MDTKTNTPACSLVPILPLRGSVVLPGITLPLRIGRPSSIAALHAAKERPWALVLTQKSEENEAEAGPDDLFRVGTLVKLEKIRGSEKNGFQVLVRGVARFRVRGVFRNGSYLEAEGEPLPDEHDVDEKTGAVLLDSLKTAAKEILRLLPADTEQFQELIDGIHDLELLTNLCAGNIDIPVPEKQSLLEMVSVKGRVLRLLDLMVSQKQSLEVQSEVREKLSHKLGRNQREQILREQLRQIREELGEEDGSAEPGSDLGKKIEDAGMPPETKKQALDELRRLEAMGKSSPESHVIRNYLDLLCAMPWARSAPSEVDLERARRVLDEDHYGLERIKKRILQHLAVLKLKKEGRGTILLFVGPPGVGKTSLGQSIARALGRRFARASLGGVRDDAEIRGHRRTYIGAMPGRIIQSIKRAGENNPVLLLDEIDKMGASYHGDPGSALLEVLDPEQNSGFLDHYLDVPFDLSRIVFIATANTLDTIPPALRDRLEVIELSGYTTAEKLHIARRHLLPKQIREHGLDDSQLSVSDEALLRVISHHTREAGVRELQRKVAELVRSGTEKILQGSSVRIEASDLEELLGPERYLHEVAERLAPPGVVTGMAWTPVGGDILFVEAELMPGNGQLTLTGQLGDVMKESAQIALSLVRSRLAATLPGFDFARKDLHLHVPSGSIPKDGPSAGITMLAAIASLFSGRRVNPRLAMTGELTLRGAILPVGGIKEKVIAAHRAGIELILLPKRNEKDLREVPDELKSRLRFEFVEHAGDVLKIALGLELAEPSAQEHTRPGSAPPASA